MSDNQSSADDQQERPGIDWVVGFVDGEGCFYIGINRNPTMRLGWQVLPEFRVVQHRQNEHVLWQLQRFFGCGQVTVNHADRMELRIRGLDNPSRAVVPFFEKHPLRTSKQRDFELFAEAIWLMQAKQHLTEVGLRHMAELAWQMNRGVKPQYLESSETTRRTSGSNRQMKR